MSLLTRIHNTWKGKLRHTTMSLQNRMKKYPKYVQGTG